MTDALIRRAEYADLAAIAQLRREWTREADGDIADPDFEEILAAWFAREWSRRIMWLAEVGGHPAGMMNLAIYELRRSERLRSCGAEPDREIHPAL